MRGFSATDFSSITFGDNTLQTVGDNFMRSADIRGLTTLTFGANSLQTGGDDFLQSLSAPDLTTLTF